MSRTTTSLAAIAAIAALGLAACSSGTTTPATQSSAPASADASQASSVSIESNDGTVEIKLPVTRAASLDNRTFEVLQQWRSSPHPRS